MPMSISVTALILAAASVASACKLHSFSASGPSPPVGGGPQSADAYTPHEMNEALHGLGAYTKGYLDPTTTTFACVDSRGSTTTPATLETPGGDISELAALIVAYHRVKGTNVTEKSVKKIFKAFMSSGIVTPERPFYYHTADDKVTGYVFPYYMNATGTEEQVVAIPSREPKNKTESTAWYSALAYPAAQGCGHIRLTMQRASDYGLNTPKEAAVMGQLIKAFYAYWWPTREFSKQRSLVVLPILQGVLDGRATAIINNVGPKCKRMEPDMVPFHGGSTMFIYQANAVARFRANTLMDFIGQYDRRIDTASVLEELTKLQATQLTATLSLLPPVNALPIYTVNVTTR